MVLQFTHRHLLEAAQVHESRRETKECDDTQQHGNHLRQDVCGEEDLEEETEAGALRPEATGPYWCHSGHADVLFGVLIWRRAAGGPPSLGPRGATTLLGGAAAFPWDENPPHHGKQGSSAEADEEDGSPVAVVSLHDSDVEYRTDENGRACGR